MKKIILFAGLLIAGVSASAQVKDTTKQQPVAQAQVPEQKIFLLVGTEEQFNLLFNLLRQTVLPITPDASFALLNWIGSRQEFKPDAKKAETKNTPK